MNASPEHARQIEIQQFDLWDKVRTRRIPLSFDAELTPRCNNACRHCYIYEAPDNANVRERELSAEQWDSIAAQAVDLGVLWCLLTGGEPLLRPDFTRIYRNMKQPGCWCRCSPTPVW